MLQDDAIDFDGINARGQQMQQMTRMDHMFISVEVRELSTEGHFTLNKTSTHRKSSS